MTRADIPVKCTRCRSEHMESDRIPRPRLRKPTSAMLIHDLLCPHCGAKTCYDMTPQVAWCSASGRIHIGNKMPADNPDGSGFIQIAKGPKCSLERRLKRASRQDDGAMFVPGVPDADDQIAKADALRWWLIWHGKSKTRDGVVFTQVDMT